MFVHYRTQGIILKKEDLGEADQLFTIYTKDFGKLEVLAKAIRKITSKLRSAMEIFYLSEIEFIQGKTYKTLTDAILIDKFPNLRKDLKRLKISYQISEVLDKLVKGQERDIKIWNLLKESLEYLNNWKIEDFWGKKNWKLEIIYYYFLWNLLSTLGYRPQLYRCLICQKKLVLEKLFFSAREGGVICQNCQKSVRLNNHLPSFYSEKIDKFKREKEKEKGVFLKEIEIETIKLLRILIEQDWSILRRLRIDPQDFDLLKKISQYFLSEIYPLQKNFS